MRAARWCLFNFAILACAWYGVHGVEWAWNLTRFAIVLGCYVGTVIVVKRDHPDFKPKIAKGRGVPAWLSYAVDTTVIVILVAFGHFVWGGLKFWELSCESAVYDGVAPAKESA